MAWSVPVVAVATSAPAYANASDPILVFSCGTACKHPGEGQDHTNIYHFTFCFQNSSGVEITVTLIDLQVNSIKRVAPLYLEPATITVAPGATVCKYVDAGDFPSSPQGIAVLSYTYAGEGIIGSGTAFQAVADNLPPCGTGADPGNNPSDEPPHDPDGVDKAQCLPK